MSSYVRRSVLSLIALVIGMAEGGIQGADPDVASVVVVANSNDGGSISVARHYLTKRGIPGENLILLDTPIEETVDWGVFVNRIYNPLLEALMQKGWIDAVRSRLKDNKGRLRVAVSGHSIKYLVLCRGIPLKINHNARIFRIEGTRGVSEQFATNRASVDSELCLIGHAEAPVNGWLANPLFERSEVSALELQQIVRVARLDGPTASDARNLVDGALSAEEKGLIGRAYVDIGGRHPSGDQWLRRVEKSLGQMHYDISAHLSNGTFSAVDRFDAPAMYFGWYAQDVNGPFLNPGFRFVDGAIAFHIHSYSAATLRDPWKYWCGPFVALGAAATVGNVSEPYLPFTHRPDLLLDRLADGAELGEAAYFALNVVSWQAVLIGDPLYRPFNVPFDVQFDRRAFVPPKVRQYLVIRKMRALAAENRAPDAIAVGENGFREYPGLALAVALGEAYLKAGQPEEAARVLECIDKYEWFGKDDWVLAGEIAKMLVLLQRPDDSVEVYRSLIRSPDLPQMLLMEFLEAGMRTAEKAGNIRLYRKWRKRLL